MNTPLDVALSIRQVVVDARTARMPLDLAIEVEELVVRFPDCGYSRVQIAETLQEEAIAAGVVLH